MTDSLYINTVEPGCGKVVFSLGLLELALRRTTRVGFFRPVIEAPAHGKCDEDIDLVLRYFGLPQAYADSYAWFQHEVLVRLGDHQEDEVIERIIDRYKQLERQCDFILIEGTDFLGHVSALEFDLNALIARNLSAPMLIG